MRLHEATLGEIKLDDLVKALGRERSAWIASAAEEKKQSTEAERATICFLAALEHVFGHLDGLALEAAAARELE